MAFKRIIATLTLLCFLLCLQGCYSNRLIPLQKLEEDPDYRIVKVVTVDNEVIEFDTQESEGAAIIDGKIEGLSKDGSFRSIPLSEVKMAQVKKSEVGKAVVWIVVIPGLVALVMCVIIGAAVAGSL